MLANYTTRLCLRMTGFYVFRNSVITFLPNVPESTPHPGEFLALFTHYLTTMGLLTLSHASRSLPHVPRRAFIKGWQNHKLHRLSAALRVQEEISMCWEYGGRTHVLLINGQLLTLPSSLPIFSGKRLK